MLEDPAEKKVFCFVFNKKDSQGMPVNIALDVPGETREAAADKLKHLFASMIMDLNEKYPAESKGRITNADKPPL